MKHENPQFITEGSFIEAAKKQSEKSNKEDWKKYEERKALIKTPDEEIIQRVKEKSGNAFQDRGMGRARDDLRSRQELPAVLPQG